MEIISKKETSNDDVEVVKDIVQGILKAKKILNMYPPNNPIYIRTADETYSKFKKFLDLNNDLEFKISQNEILFHDAEVYFNPEKDDNLALFFFKDGVRELTFLKGLGQNEFKDFIGLLNTDFENIKSEDDIVTLLWERDFENIKYVATEEFLTDEGENKQRESVTAKDEENAGDNLTQAYNDGLRVPSQQAQVPMQLTGDDLRKITKEIEDQENSPQIDKIITVVFELLYQTREEAIYPDVVDFLKQLLDYFVKNGDFKRICIILDSIKIISSDGSIGDDNVNILQRIYSKINDRLFIQETGRMLESDVIMEESEFLDFIRHLNKTSIPHLIKLLEDLQRIRSRRFLISALSVVGRLDIQTLAEGLNSNRWYVVRNIILVLGKIADSWSLEHLAKILRHPDARVRREAIKTLASIGGKDTLLYLKDAFSDEISAVRIAAVTEIGNIKTDAAKSILLTELRQKKFLQKSFNEKKVFYEAVARWNDQQVRDFLHANLRKKKFWNTTKNDETRACAAHALGIIGDKEAIPYLERAKTSKNELLATFSTAALKRLTE